VPGKVTHGDAPTPFAGVALPISTSAAVAAHMHPAAKICPNLLAN
jgi:hypothetical protein